MTNLISNNIDEAIQICAQQVWHDGGWVVVVDLTCDVGIAIAALIRTLHGFKEVKLDCPTLVLTMPLFHMPLIVSVVCELHCIEWNATASRTVGKTQIAARRASCAPVLMIGDLGISWNIRKVDMGAMN